MNILSMEELILNMAAVIMAKGDFCLFGTLDPHGQTTVQGGTKRDKGQFIKTKWMIPHEVINEKMIEDISVINYAFIGPMAGIPRSFMNEKGRDLKKRADESFAKRIKGSPRLEAAIKELQEAIKEEALRVSKAEDKKTAIDKVMKTPEEDNNAETKLEQVFCADGGSF